jgi:predicted DNA-binding transcriptional regulator AlpA
MSVEFVKPVAQRQKMRGHKASSGNTKPLPVLLSLDQPGRLRTGHLLTLLSITSPTLYKRINAGVIPKPDGNDGRPFWLTSTVRAYLAGADNAINCAGGQS